MARIGMRKPLFCLLNEDESLGTVNDIGKALSADVQIRTTESKIYADGTLVESSKEFSSGTITLNVDDLTTSALATLCGHTLDGNELTAQQTDNAPYGRLCWIIPKRKNNKPRFRVICLMKVKFGIPSERSESKGENITFGTETINGEILANATGDWKKERTFGSLAEAITYQKSLMTNTPVYGLEHNASTDTCKRTGLAENLTMNYAINDEVVHNDFDNFGPWRHMYKVEDDKGNTFVRIPKVYCKYTKVGDRTIMEISEKPFDGSYLSPCFYDFENQVELPYIDIGAYNAYIENETMKSIPDVAPGQGFNIVQARTYAMNNGAGYQQLDIHAYDVLCMLIWIEFGTINVQDVIKGYSTGRYSSTELSVISEENTNRIIVTNSTAGNYKVGQTISVGTSQGGNQVFYGRNILDISDYDTDNKAITFDGDPVSVEAGNCLYNTAAKTGFSKDYQSSISVMEANDGKYPFTYRGIENPYGSIYQFVDGININDNQAWACDDAREYTSNLFTSPYKQLGYINSNANGYVKALGWDETNPTVKLPVDATAGNSGAYYGDYYYQNSGPRIARVGGYWNNGSSVGLSYWYLNNSSSTTVVALGGRLLKKAL